MEIKEIKIKILLNIGNELRNFSNFYILNDKKNNF